MGALFSSPSQVSCPLCDGETFENTKAWEKHMADVHPPVQCPLCPGAVFKTVQSAQTHFRVVHDHARCDVCYALGKPDVMVLRNDWIAHREAHKCEHNAMKGLCCKCRYEKVQPDWARDRVPGLYHICFIGRTCTGKTSCWNQYGKERRSVSYKENKEDAGEEIIGFRGYQVCLHDIPGISAGNSHEEYVAKFGLRYADGIVLFLDSTAKLMPDELSVLNELLSTGYSKRILVVLGKVDGLMRNAECSNIQELLEVVRETVKEARDTISNEMGRTKHPVNIVPLFQGKESLLDGMTNDLKNFMKQTRAHFEQSLVDTVKAAERDDSIAIAPFAQCCICLGDTKPLEACYAFSNCGHMCVCNTCEKNFSTTKPSPCPMCRVEGILLPIFHTANNNLRRNRSAVALPHV